MILTESARLPHIEMKPSFLNKIDKIIRSAFKGELFGKQESLKSNTLEINGEKILIFGEVNNKKLLEQAISYQRVASNCLQDTEREILQKKASGYFTNDSAPIHFLPAIKSRNRVLAYDKLMDEENDRVVFVGNKKQVSQAIENFYKINNPYNGKFRYIRGKID